MSSSLFNHNAKFYHVWCTFGWVHGCMSLRKLLSLSVSLTPTPLDYRCPESDSNYKHHDYQSVTLTTTLTPSHKVENMNTTSHIIIGFETWIKGHCHKALIFYYFHIPHLCQPTFCRLSVEKVLHKTLTLKTIHITSAVVCIFIRHRFSCWKEPTSIEIF